MAKNWITSASYDAVPAHPRLIDDALVGAICRYGETKFRPHPRPTALEPVDTAELLKD